MIQRRSPFRTPLTRPLATALCSVFLALSVSSGFHQGDHDDLGWLPERFHRHAYEWSPESRDAPVPVIDHCLACHLARTIVRFTPPGPAAPRGADPLRAAPTAGTGEVLAQAAFPRNPRAPPAS